MPKELFSPLYLTEEIAQKAVEVVLRAVFDVASPVSGVLKRNDLHVVVVVPGIQSLGATDWTETEVRPLVLYEKSEGKVAEWASRYDQIARAKAEQLWFGRNDGEAGIIPHLLFAGDTCYWGGVKRNGIVVACSGVQPWFDRMIASMVADVIIALAHNAYEQDKDRQSGDFLQSH